MIPDFELQHKGGYAVFLDKLGIHRFSELAAYLKHLPYGRTSSRADFKTVFTESKGTCSSKHAILGELCVLNGQDDVELLVGIFLMDASYSPKLQVIFEHYQLQAIPEAHCYLRYKSQRYDFSSSNSHPDQFQGKLIREQRCEPAQVVDWKPMIHKHFIESWLKRQKHPYSLEELFQIREECIAALAHKT